MDHAGLLHGIEEDEVAFGELEHGDVTFGAFAQRAQAFGKSEGVGGIGGGAGDDIFQFHSQVEEFGESGGEIENGAMHVELVHIARDGTGGEVLFERGFGDVPAEGAGAVAYVKADAVGDDFTDFGQDAHVGVHDAAFAGAIGMGDDVAFSEEVENFGEGRKCAADVDHERKADGVGCFAGHAEGLEVMAAGDVFGETDLDAEDDVAIRFDGFDGELGIGEAEVDQLAPGVVGGEGGLADDGDIEKGHDARVDDVDDVLAQAGKCVRAGGTGVDDCGDAFGDAVGIGGNAEGGDAIVDVNVDVDEAGGYEFASRVDDLAGLGLGNGFRDARDFAAGDCDVADR